MTVGGTKAASPRRGRKAGAKSPRARKLITLPRNAALGVKYDALMAETDLARRGVLAGKLVDGKLKVSHIGRPGNQSGNVMIPGYDGLAANSVEAFNAMLRELGESSSVSSSEWKTAWGGRTVRAPPQRKAKK